MKIFPNIHMSSNKGRLASTKREKSIHYSPHKKIDAKSCNKKNKNKNLDLPTRTRKHWMASRVENIQINASEKKNTHTPHLLGTEI